jgi:hypothetical protein
MMIKKFRMLGGQPYPVIFKDTEVASIGNEDKTKLQKYISMPEVVTPDIVAFEGRYLQSGANLNKAYFDQVELVKAYDTISYKALDREHVLEDIVGHIYTSKFIDRKTNRELTLESLKSMDEISLRSTNIDVIVGGVVYIDRFPALESPLSRKAPAISMETYFSGYDLLLSNGVKVTMEEAEALGLSSLVDQLLAQYDTFEELNAAHQVKVILADKSEVKMEVFKWLIGLSFSGGGLVASPACKVCTLLSTSLDSCDCADKDPESDEASFHAQADTLLTINLTELDSYMRDWRESKDGKPLNHQVVDVIDNETTKEVEASENNPPSVAEPDGKTRDPLATDKGPARCPQYKYELWTQRGEGENIVEEQQRHWCVYANDKCPTAGDRTWHECLRWYKRENDWIQDMRNFRDDNNPFAPEGEADEGEKSIMMSSSIEFKKMDAMVDSFLYKVESLQRDREIKEKTSTRHKDTKKSGGK